MLKKIVLIAAIVFPLFVSAQFSTDPKESQNITDECGDIVFTKTEKLPSFNPSKEVFEDSLTVYLKSENAFKRNKTILLKFILTKKSELFAIEKISGNYSKKDILINALSHFAGSWIPANQNSRSVCSYVNCEIDFDDNKLTVNVSQ